MNIQIRVHKVIRLINNYLKEINLIILLLQNIKSLINIIFGKNNKSQGCNYAKNVCNIFIFIDFIACVYAELIHSQLFVGDLSM